MLEIIGLLGCLYLLVKGLQIIGDQSNRVSRSESDETRLSLPALFASLIAVLGSGVFAILVVAQASTVATS